MQRKQAVPANIDEYIAGFPKQVREKLAAMRATISKAAPAAEEKISYLMPAFALHGNLVYFAAFTKHIGFYPGARAVAKFKQQLSAYKGAKGSVQFPFYEPIPLTLVRKIVQFRVQENLAKAAAKGRM